MGLGIGFLALRIEHPTEKGHIITQVAPFANSIPCYGALWPPSLFYLFLRSFITSFVFTSVASVRSASQRQTRMGGGGKHGNETPQCGFRHDVVPA